MKSIKTRPLSRTKIYRVSQQVSCQKFILTFFRKVQMLHCCHAHSKGFNIFLIRFEVEGFLWKRKKRLMAFAFLGGYKENLYLEGWIVTLLDNFRLLSLHFLYKKMIQYCTSHCGKTYFSILLTLAWFINANFM